MDNCNWFNGTDFHSIHLLFDPCAKWSLLRRHLWLYECKVPVILFYYTFASLKSLKSLKSSRSGSDGKSNCDANLRRRVMWLVGNFSFLIVLATGSPLRVASSTILSMSSQAIWLASAERMTLTACSTTCWFISISRALRSSSTWMRSRFASRFSWSNRIFDNFFMASRSWRWQKKKRKKRNAFNRVAWFYLSVLAKRKCWNSGGKKIVSLHGWNISKSNSSRIFCIVFEWMIFFFVTYKDRIVEKYKLPELGAAVPGERFSDRVSGSPVWKRIRRQPRWIRPVRGRVALHVVCIASGGIPDWSSNPSEPLLPLRSNIRWMQHRALLVSGSRIPGWFSTISIKLLGGGHLIFLHFECAAKYSVDGLQSQIV